jgi:Zn-dependent peptidase ImmA (M78 family)
MTAEKRNIINDIAVNLRDALDINSEDFDIVKTVIEIGGEIEYTDDFFQEEEAVKKEDGSFLIRINKNYPEARQRFTIARELGHLFIHMKFGYDEWDRIKPSEKRFWIPGLFTGLAEEANEFSAAFLMPAESFINIAKETSDDDFFYPKKIAARFNVYEDAVIYRGKNLSLWK